MIVNSVGEGVGNRVTRILQILFIVMLAVAFGAAFPSPARADDMVLFKNGRTLRADELELKNGVYRITTMTGGVMEIPVQLVEQVISCVVDKDVEEQRGTVPAGAAAPAVTGSGDHSNATKIPPAGLGGAAGSMGKGFIGGGKPGEGKSGDGAMAIPPRGGKSLGRGGAARTRPAKGADEKK